jgi:hypothetical protein
MMAVMSRRPHHSMNRNVPRNLYRILTHVSVASLSRLMAGWAVEVPDRPVPRFADQLLSKPTKQVRRRARQDRCAVARGNNCHQSRRATLLTIRITKRLWLGPFFRAIRWNTNNQPEVACADRPGRLGWFRAPGGPQMRPPAGLPRLPKRASRAP